MTDLPETLPGHWMTPGGLDKAQEYARVGRDRLGKPDMTDFELANAQFMASREDLDLIVYQTAAKERIRWLSVQLALAQLELAKVTAERDSLQGDRDLDEAGPR